MGYRRFLVGLGAGTTAFLLVAVLVIEAVAVDPGAGILGVLLGAMVGVAVLGTVVLKFEEADGTLQSGIQAVAAFGYVVLVLYFVEYANVGGLRSAIDTVSVAVAATIAAIVTFVVARTRQ